MRIRRDHPVVRGLGVVFGIGILALGLAGVLGVADSGDGLGPTGILGLGLTLFLGGVATIVASLTVVDPTKIF